MRNSAQSARKDATNISTFWVIHYIQAGGFKGPSNTSQAPFLTCRLHRVTDVQINAARMMVMGAAILPRKLTTQEKIIATLNLNFTSEMTLFLSITDITWNYQWQELEATMQQNFSLHGCLFHPLQQLHHYSSDKWSGITSPIKRARQQQRAKWETFTIWTTFTSVQHVRHEVAHEGAQVRK